MRGMALISPDMIALSDLIDFIALRGLSTLRDLSPVRFTDELEEAKSWT